MTDDKSTPNKELSTRRRRLADQAARMATGQDGDQAGAGAKAETEAQALRRALNESARLLQANRPGEAVELLQPLHGRHRTHPDLAINLGGAYILQRKWDKAAKVLAPAAEANAHNPMLWTNLAAAYLGRLELSGPKQQRQAIAAYERALAADPKTPNVHYHLGLIYKDQANFDQARHYFEQALVVNPKDRDAKHWISVLDKIKAAGTITSGPENGSDNGPENESESGAGQN